MLLKYIGTSAAEEDVAKACGTTELGTTPLQLVKGSKVFGFDNNNITYHDPDIPDGQDAKCSIERFMQAWSALKRWVIKLQKVKQ